MPVFAEAQRLRDFSSIWVQKTAIEPFCRSETPLSPLAVFVGPSGAVRYSVEQLTAPRDVDAPLNRHIVARP